MALRARRRGIFAMHFEKYESTVVRKAIGRDVRRCERNAAEGFDGVDVELGVGLADRGIPRQGL